MLTEADSLLHRVESLNIRSLLRNVQDEKLKKKLDAQLKDLLDKGVRILKNSSPNLSAHGAASRNGSARNGSGSPRKAAAVTAKAGKK